MSSIALPSSRAHRFTFAICRRVALAVPAPGRGHGFVVFKLGADRAQEPICP
jgi:hypothetical protein